jgi:integrase
LKANVKAVEHAKPGRHQIEGVKGLYLSVGDNGAARWLYRYHRQGKPTETGLGSTSDVTLAEAIDKAQDHRRLVKAGGDPIAAKRAARRKSSVDVLTFADVVDQYHARFAGRGPRAAAALIRRHCRALTTLPLAELNRAAVKDCLDPLQQSLPKTRARALKALSTVFGYAVENDMLPTNPADPRLFKKTWPATPKATHYRALDYRECPALFGKLVAKGSTVALALAFLMLNGSRTTEVLASRRDEVDGDVWTISAARMKNRKPHVVPLTPAALSILGIMRERFPSSDYLFPADHCGRLSVRVFEGLLHRQMKLPVSAHGFRSSLRDYLGNETDVPRETCEEVLSHACVGVEGAYRRQSSTTKKRAAVELWAAYLTGGVDPTPS